jgi:hypothetical protein
MMPSRHMAVGQRADHFEGVLQARGDGGVALKHLAQGLNLVVGPMGDIGEGAIPLWSTAAGEGFEGFPPLSSKEKSICRAAGDVQERPFLSLRYRTWLSGLNEDRTKI